MSPILLFGGKPPLALLRQLIVAQMTELAAIVREENNGPEAPNVVVLQVGAKKHASVLAAVRDGVELLEMERRKMALETLKKMLRFIDTQNLDALLALLRAHAEEVDAALGSAQDNPMRAESLERDKFSTMLMLGLLTTDGKV